MILLFFLIYDHPFEMLNKKFKNLNTKNIIKCLFEIKSKEKRLT